MTGPTSNRTDDFSPRLERAMRFAALAHRDQKRKGGDIPYLIHPFGVGLLLDRQGYSENVVIAGLLHDAVEDSDTTIDQIEREFGPKVGSIVAALSERKLDESGKERPWIDRKREHIEVLAAAPVESRAVALADKILNLVAIRVDLDAGRPVWSIFKADRAGVLWYFETCIDRYSSNEPDLARLAELARAELDWIREHSEADNADSISRFGKD